MTDTENNATAGTTTLSHPRTLNDGDYCFRTAIWLSSEEFFENGAAWRPDYPLLRRPPFRPNRPDGTNEDDEDNGDEDDDSHYSSDEESEDTEPRSDLDPKPLIIMVYIPDENEEDWQEYIPPGLTDTVDIEWTCSIAAFERLLWLRPPELGADVDPESRMPNPRLRAVIITDLEVLSNQFEPFTDHIMERHERMEAQWTLLLAPRVAGEADEDTVQNFLYNVWDLDWQISGRTIGACNFELTPEAQENWQIPDIALGGNRCEFPSGVFRILHVEPPDCFLQLCLGQRLHRSTIGRNTYFVANDEYLSADNQEIVTQWCPAALDILSYRGFIGYASMNSSVVDTIMLMCGIQRDSDSTWRVLDSEELEPVEWE